MYVWKNETPATDSIYTTHLYIHIFRESYDVNAKISTGMEMFLLLHSCVCVCLFCVVLFFYLFFGFNLNEMIRCQME